MKFGTRLIAYYLTATLLSMLLVGFAVLKGVEYTGIMAVEKQLIEQSQTAQIYTNQTIYLENNYNQELDPELARKITGYLSSGLGKHHIYDRDLYLLSSSVELKQSTYEENGYHSEILGHALEGNYSYFVQDNVVYFSSPIDFRGEIIGVLEIVYPLGFLNEIINSIIKILFIGALAFGILIAVLSVYIAGRVVRPIKRLAFLVDRYSKRDFQPVSIERSDELGMLCKSFNTMGLKLQDYIQRQKQFVSNVSHELRTPLTAVKGYSDYLADEVKGNPDMEKAVYHLTNESDRLSALVDELLLLSRIDSSKEAFELSRVDLSLVTKEAVSKMELREQRYNVKINTELEADVYICGDPQKLIQVVINILDNAIKFSPKGSVVNVKLWEDENKAILEVSDRGMGIPEGEISRVFDRFYRADNARSVNGSGLGLSISKEIIEFLKGTISIKTEVGKVTTVLIELPLWKEGGGNMPGKGDFT